MYVQDVVPSVYEHEVAQKKAKRRGLNCPAINDCMIQVEKKPPDA